MPLIHDPAKGQELLRSFTPKQWQDGVLFDVPKQRRRHQAMGLKRLIVVLDADLQKRFATQINRWVEVCIHKGVAWDLMCRQLEQPSDEQIKTFADGEEALR